MRSRASSSHGTGTAAYFGRPAAGKTGTAEDFKDAWFCGYVPQLAACVWIGYPKAEIPLSASRAAAPCSAARCPAEIWNRFMSEAVKKLPVKDFVYPQFTGHTVSSPYSYIPAATDDDDDDRDAHDAARPAADPPDAGTDAAEPPLRRRRPPPAAPPPTTTIGDNGQ